MNFLFKIVFFFACGFRKIDLRISCYKKNQGKLDFFHIIGQIKVLNVLLKIGYMPPLKENLIFIFYFSIFSLPSSSSDLFKPFKPLNGPSAPYSPDPLEFLEVNLNSAHTRTGSTIFCVLLWKHKIKEYKIEVRYNWRGPPFHGIIHALKSVLHLYKKYLE